MTLERIGQIRDAMEASRYGGPLPLTEQELAEVLDLAEAAMRMEAMRGVCQIGAID